MDVINGCNQTRAARSFDFEITRMISDQIALHLVQLPLLKLTHEVIRKILLKALRPVSRKYSTKNQNLMNKSAVPCQQTSPILYVN